MLVGALGMRIVAAAVSGVLIFAPFLWHVQRSLCGGLQCISNTNHRAFICSVLNTLHLSCSTMIFTSGWASLKHHFVGYEHYPHHALTEYVKQ